MNKITIQFDFHFLSFALGLFIGSVLTWICGFSPAWGVIIALILSVPLLMFMAWLTDCIANRDQCPHKDGYPTDL